MFFVDFLKLRLDILSSAPRTSCKPIFMMDWIVSFEMIGSGTFFSILSTYSMDHTGGDTTFIALSSDRIDSRRT